MRSATFEGSTHLAASIYRLNDFRSSRSRETCPAADDELWRAFIRLSERRGSDWQTLQRIPAGQFWGSVDFADKTIAALERDLKRSSSCENAAIERLLIIPSQMPDGFDIELHFQGSRISGWFGGLEQDFFAVADAFVWVRRGLSQSYRLSIIAVGGWPCQWVLAPAVPSIDPSGRLMSGHPVWFRSWRSETIEYRQNVLFTK